MSSRMSYIEAIREAHRQEMRRDESVVLLGIDVGPLGGLFGATKTLHAEFGPSRVLEFPISETGYIPAPHLDKHGNGVIAWHCFIKDGHVRFEESAIPEERRHIAGRDHVVFPRHDGVG